VRSSVSWRFAVLTVSDRAAAGVYEDLSGPALVEFVQTRLGAALAATAVVPDEAEDISRQLKQWADDDRVELVLTTGGTGFAPRDVTPEATKSIMDRDAPGLAEAMRAASRDITPHAMLSRGVAVIRDRTLIINLPGSPRGATENLQVVLPALPHAIELLQDTPGAERGHVFHHHHTA
jgi:gephyrin